MKSRKVQQKTSENKQMLDQVIRQLQVRGLVSKQQNLISCSLNPLLQINGVSPKVIIEAAGLETLQKYDQIQKVQQQLQLQQSMMMGDFSDDSGLMQLRRKNKLKAKNTISQYNQISKKDQQSREQIQEVQQVMGTQDISKLVVQQQQQQQQSTPKQKMAVPNNILHLNRHFAPCSIESFNINCQQLNTFLQLTMQKKSTLHNPQSSKLEMRTNNNNKNEMKQSYRVTGENNGAPMTPHTQTLSTMGPQNINPQHYNKIITMGKFFNYPSEFLKKNLDDMHAFLKTKDFIVMIRGKMHMYFNQMVQNQYKLTALNPAIPEPKILKQFKMKNAGDPHQMSPTKHNQQQQRQLNDIKNGNQQNMQLTFKFYTDSSGNNYPIVRQILKRRTWLSRIDKINKIPGAFEQVNLFWTQWKRNDITHRLNSHQIYAKVDGNYLITNKANLYQTMLEFFQKVLHRNVHDLMPITYYLTTEADMAQNELFKYIVEQYQKKVEEEENSAKSSKIKKNKHNNSAGIWIVKPGENSNRGRGIRIFTCFDKIKTFLEQKAGEKWVIQKYIERPILVGGTHWFNTPMRKFDIRMFGLCQIIDGIHFRGYFYREGYIRTSSYKYDLQDLEDRDVHLTNDAVQDRNEEYGKYEQGNKISQRDFANYLKKHRGISYYQHIHPKIREAIQFTLHAFWLKLQARLESDDKTIQPTTETPPIGEDEPNPNEEQTIPIIKHNQFELFGYDFMIDEDYKVYLIEVNTNPCLETPCPLLQRLITQVLDQSFKIAVDPFLQPSSPPNSDHKKSDNHYATSHEMSISEYQYEMVYSNAQDVLSDPDKYLKMQERELKRDMPKQANKAYTTKELKQKSMTSPMAVKEDKADDSSPLQLVEHQYEPTFKSLVTQCIQYQQQQEQEVNAPSQSDAAAATTADPITTEAATSAPATEAATTETDVKAADEATDALTEEK